MNFLDRHTKYLNEGIEVRLNGKQSTVSLTDKHEKGVDTSLSNNPTRRLYKMDDGKDVWIYSIFQRNKALHPHDGNPLLYAIKKENGFTFASSYEEKQFWVRFENILDKFIKQYNDITNVGVVYQSQLLNWKCTGIITPSSKPINKKIAEILKSKTGLTVIDNVLMKKSNEEIYYACASPSSYFYKYWSKRNKFDEMLEYLEDTYLYSDGYFKMHSIKPIDTEIRSTIKNTLKLNPDYIDDYISEINDKHILIIDDTITLGQTFRSAYNAITSVYFPKSIAGLTMFSEKI